MFQQVVILRGILSSTFVGCYKYCDRMHGVYNIKFIY